MTRKIITGVIAAVLLVTIAVLAAEKVKEKAFTEKAKAGERGEGFERHEGLLDQLAEAYKANDKAKMGEIINIMQERREKMREFVKLNRWHRWAHRRMMGQMGPGWGQGHGPQMAEPSFNRGWGMAGPGWHHGWAMQGQGWNQGCQMAGAIPRWGQFQAMNGCGCGHCDGMGRANQMPQQGFPRQMPDWGRGLQQNWTPRPGADNMGQQEWNMPRREKNIPPPEWGW